MSQCFACIKTRWELNFNDVKEHWTCKRFDTPKDAVEWQSQKENDHSNTTKIHYDFRIHNIKEYPNNEIAKSIFKWTYGIKNTVDWL